MSTIKIKFDPSGNPELPTLVLAKRSGERIGELSNIEPPHVTGNLNSYAELGFTLNKYKNGKEVPCWDEVKNGRNVWCKEWDKWMKMTVQMTEGDSDTKEVTCQSLAEFELSNVLLDSLEVNTETDIARDDYKPTILYDSENPNCSLMDRMLKKTPAFQITHVDASIANIQRTFSFDGTSIYDAFQSVAEEIQCLFIFDVTTDAAYDLLRTCLDCGYRDDFDGDICPKCGKSHIQESYGEDTTIFVSREDLAESITLTTDTDSVKNCFKLTPGDDLMTAAVIGCNPNGSDYIWDLSADMVEDMSPELQEKLADYNEQYDYYQTDHEVTLDADLVSQYNALVEKYRTYNKELPKLNSSIVGYANLINAIYDAIDFDGYLRDTLMPDAKLSDTSAELELAKLTAKALSPVSVQNVSIMSEATAKSAVLSMAKALTDNRYQVKIAASSLSGSVWIGRFTVTNYSDDEDTATGDTDIAVEINDDYSSFVSQMIKKTLAKGNTDNMSITGLFQKNLSEFKADLKKHCLSNLKSFYDSCQGCLSVMIEQGVASDDNKNSEIYKQLYDPYYEKSLALSEEIALRESELQIISGKTNEDGKIEIDGIQTLLNRQKEQINAQLDFEKYLGTDLWLEFTTYRMEDEYSNSNYVSDGLTNAEIFDRAREFLEVAQKELRKAINLKHTISTDLKNLLVMKEFLPIIKHFQVGNWLRVRIDGKIYRLKLLSYSIDYSDLSKITVTFSDVRDIFSYSDSISDTIKSAQSMSKSYESVKRQAEQGKKSYSMTNGWVSKGLSATAIPYQNADNQTILMDSHGLLARQQNPITEEYSDKQVKLISTGLAFTTDNWRTVASAVGEFSFYNPITKQMESSYGVIANTIVGNVVLSEKTAIFNKNNSMTLDQDGLIITTNGNAGTTSAFTIQKQTTDSDGNTSIDRQLYINSNGDVVLKGSLLISSDGGEQTIDDKFHSVNDYISESINNMDVSDGSKIGTAISDKCEAIKKYADAQLNDYKTTVGQYLDFSSSTGLTIGAQGSAFSTVITNDRMAFTESDKVVAYISNNQLNIENAIIRDSFVIGRFYWIPRNDGSISISWR